MAAVYWRLYRRSSTTGQANRAERRSRIAAAVVGILTLWLALDWPLGTLGAGYLASVHMVQFLLVAMAAAPLLVYGLPISAMPRLDQYAEKHAVVRALTHPVLWMCAFDVVVVTTHVPHVVDALMASQLGSFVLDILWLVSAIGFWWPVVRALPGRGMLSGPIKLGYLFFGTLAHTGVATYLLLAAFPVYRTYELAPPIAGVSPLSDQEVAGGLMLLIGSIVVLGAISVVFFRWQHGLEEHG
jgi:putative membrane protein